MMLKTSSTHLFQSLTGTGSSGHFSMGSPCSPVVANIYMEYFENLALGAKLPVPVKDWKRCVDDVFSIIPKGN